MPAAAKYFLPLAVILFVVILTPSTLAQWNPNFVAGRTTIVHLFEWKWNDIADECERFLGPKGFGGVQTSPVNENAIILNPFRPWWERYQPVSYKVETRSGTDLEFQSMVRRCNAVGVRIYVDAVLNHMTGPIGAGYGTNGSYFDSDAKRYDGVPFSPFDFTPRDQCTTQSGGVENTSYPCCPDQVRNCELSGLKDLYGGGSWVQNRQVQFLNKLIGYGVAGFRIDAAKHMWVEDIEIVLRQLNDLSTSHGFPAGTRPFIFQEVIDQGGEAIKGDEYFRNGRVTEFKASVGLGQVFNGRTQLRYLFDFGIPNPDGVIGWGLYPSINSLSFVDNHDNQRGHGAGGKDILSYHNSRQYKMATAFKLAWPYSTTRIMSSYFFDRDTQTEMGPPNTNGFTNGVIIKPDGTCDGGWVCEHRWRQIFNMVEFRNVVDGTNMNDWWADEIGGNKISFCRGDKGFVAMNNDNSLMTRTFQTCLAPGRYCDVISGSLNGTSCTDGGKIITVAPFGWADITISNEDPDPVVAIHANSRLP